MLGWRPSFGECDSIQPHSSKLAHGIMRAYRQSRGIGGFLAKSSRHKIGSMERSCLRQDKESLQRCQAIGRDVRIVHLREGEYRQATRSHTILVIPTRGARELCLTLPKKRTLAFT
jgi:hypothetical protein